MAELKESYFFGTNEWGLVLGGSSGMGLAVVKKMAEQGMNMIVLHRDSRSRLEKIEKEFSELDRHPVEIVRLNKDALNEGIIDECIHLIQRRLGEKGKIKLLLHAIAKGNLKPFVHAKHSNPKIEDGLYTEIQKKEQEVINNIQSRLSQKNVIQTSTSMAFSILPWIEKLLEHQLFSADARIIGLTSEGNKRFLPTYGAVAVAKSALESILMSLSVELAPMGIRVNVIQAGVTDTRSMRLIPGSNLILENARYRNPFGRTTTTRDIANVVYLLCRKEASWINGAIIPVDGGEKNR